MTEPTTNQHEPIEPDETAAGPVDEAVPNEDVPDEDVPNQAVLDETARRPSPGPTPTARARRAAAAGVAGAAVRRPSPRPSRPDVDQPTTGDAATTEPATVNPATTDPATVNPATAARAPGTASADVAPTPRRSRPTAPLWLAVVLAVLVLAGVAAVLVAARLSSGAGSTGQRDQALSAAKSEVPVILSYNYQSFDADVAKAKAMLTGRAVTDYGTAMAQTVKPTAVKVKAVVQAITDGAGVESVSPDGQQVVVVVFGEQKVTNSTLTAPRTDLFRVRATLNLVGGHWLVSKFANI